MNTYTGIGLSPAFGGRDKRLGSQFMVDVLTTPEAQALWRSNDLAARMVETWPSEMLRQGFELQLPDQKLPGEELKGKLGELAPPKKTTGKKTPPFARGDADPEDEPLDEPADGEPPDDLAEQVEQRWEELGLVEALWKALCYERAYGGGAILMATADSGALATPLDPERATRLESLTVFEPEELTPVYYYTDPRQPKFGQVEVWRLSARVPGEGRDGGTAVNQLDIHESRLIIFGGIRVSNQRVTTLPGWGDSIFTRANRVIRSYDSSWDATSILMQDFAQPVFKMAGLYEAVGTDNSKILRDRMIAVDMSRSVARAVFIDKDGEEFERKTTPVTGLPDLLDRYASRLAATADMPMTLLFGTSPGGLNATGESDITLFYDRVASKQTLVLRPAIKRVTQLILREFGEEPEKWSIKFRPLRQASDKEGAEARNLQSQVDERYINLGVATPEEIAKSRFGGQEYSYQTTINFNERDFAEEMEAATANDDMLAQAKVEALKSKPAGPGAGAPPFQAKQDAEARLDYIRQKSNGKWCVYSEDGKLLGEHSTRAEAARQLAAIEAHKHDKYGK